MKKAIKVLKFIATGSLALMLTACYGVMYGVSSKVVNGKVSVKNTNGEPIPGLKLSIVEDGTNVVASEITDNLGVGELMIDTYNSWFDYQVYAEDIDGLANNGYYKSELKLIESGDSTSKFYTEVVVENLMLEGRFNFTDLNDLLPPDLDIDVFVLDLDTGISTLLNATANYYSYQFLPGTNKVIRLVNNSSNYQFNVIEDQHLEFDLLDGSFSIVVQSAGASSGSSMYQAAFGIIDDLGRSLLAIENRYLILNVQLNGVDLPQNLLDSVIAGVLTLSIDPAIQNSLSFSWISAAGIWKSESYSIFPGNQSINLK
ncbi:MAG: hypothetical protein L3J12_01330 [Spirochaetales bacterium]|nr:hypothetical protein [Spirochaetales bacterium]